MPSIKKAERICAQALKNGCVKLFCILLFAVQAQAESASFTNLLAQGELAGKNNDVAAALELYSTAEQLESNNAANLCILTKHFCDLMYAAGSPALEKTLAENTLACARRAVKADPQNATAHICLAICCTKNFPFVNSQTKVNFSRLIKAESEKAIALNPKQDIAYYLLGRWNYSVANMNFFYKGLVKIVYGGLPKASNEVAIQNFKRAIALNPNRIIHHAELAKVYATTGQKNLARQELEKCGGLKPLDRDDADAQVEAAKELSVMAE